MNLTASLRATAADLSGVANGLAGLGTDDQIEQQAEILDRVAEDAGQGAAILRALLVRRERDKHSAAMGPCPGSEARTARPPRPDSR